MLSRPRALRASQYVLLYMVVYLAAQYAFNVLLPHGGWYATHRALLQQCGLRRFDRYGGQLLWQLPVPGLPVIPAGQGVAGKFSSPQRAACAGRVPLPRDRTHTESAQRPHACPCRFLPSLPKPSHSLCLGTRQWPTGCASA